ncbi:transglycosylase domain-containing protein [Alkalibacillus aidingensis]|uniref:transglycosylase domain-containing protein n=1 Tax=Alkalibacillus aidingensis TaxID=2747607 RepID=UPI0016613703|nr:PBP1A family penicillin-binding protein [Alkalibacillus aidingensis]
MAEEAKSRKKKKQAKKKNKKLNWKKIFTTLLIIGLIGFVVGIGVLYSFIKDAPDLNAEELQVPASTTILDRNGDHVADLGAENREVIDYEDLSPLLEDAVLAAEDIRFFDHNGIDLRRLGGSIIANITDGYGAQGASTITHQVIKNFLLTDVKKMERKVQEQYLAFQLERQYSKEQILMMYLNKIYYSNGIYGVQRASEVYFGKDDLNDLTIAEVALLAGIPQRPSAYDPIKNPDLAESRRNTVLDLMVRHDKISEDEAEEAKEIPVEDMIHGEYQSEVKYDSFIDRVLNEAEDLIDEDMNVGTAGLTIHTTLDPKAQDQVEYLLSDESPIDYPDQELESGIVVTDTTTGEILAIGGGRNKDEGVGAGFNYAINREGRQPGSAIKPIIVYGPAIEQEQRSTYHQYYDDESEARFSWHGEGGEEARFQNFRNQYYGWVSMREALYRSLNVPAVQTFQEIDQSQATDFAKELGITFEGQADENFALGGGRLQTNPLEMSGAYAAFGNQGIYNEPHSITKIEYRDGETIEPDYENKPVMSDYTAYMITDMLKDTVNNSGGTASGLNFGNLPVAVKTGTTNDDRDSWIVGYTTNYTVSIWNGYSDNRPGVTSVTRPILQNLMSHLSEGTETSDFTRPNSVVDVDVEKGSNPARLPSEYTPSDQIVTELFVSGNEPTEISEEYDVVDPVEQLTLNFDDEEQLIEANWQHAQDDDERELAFEVDVLMDGDVIENQDGLTETEYIFGNVEPGETYTFEISVYDLDNQDNRSEPVAESIDIPDEDSDFWDDFFGDDEEENEEEDEEAENDEEENEEQEENEDGNNDDDENDDEEPIDDDDEFGIDLPVDESDEAA